MTALNDVRQCPQCQNDVIVTAGRLKNRTYWCKPCQSKASVISAQKNPARKQAGNKKYFQTELGKQAIKRRTRAFRAKYPEKYSAYTKVGTALRSGTLMKEPCEVCGNTNVHAHHDDYEKPLSVRWLCSCCHLEHHRAMLKAREQ